MFCTSEFHIYKIKAHILREIRAKNKIALIRDDLALAVARSRDRVYHFWKINQIYFENWKNQYTIDMKTKAYRGLDKLTPSFKEKVEKFLAEVNKDSKVIFVTETWRSEERQKELVKL